MTKRADAEMLEVLATKMGWTVGKNGSLWRDGEIVATVEQSSYPCWNPFADLNAIHEIEERLTSGQRHAYVQILIDQVGDWENVDTVDWHYRHATARQCAEALAKVLTP